MKKGGGEVRTKKEGLRDALLTSARAIAAREGPDAINIRRLAADAGVATGTVYLYFASKEDVILALTEEYWRQAMMDLNAALTAAPFGEQVAQIFGFLRNRTAGKGGEWMKSLGQTEAASRERMLTAQGEWVILLAKLIRADSTIRPGVWTDRFTPDRLAEFVMDYLITRLQKKADCIDLILDILERTLYE